MNRGFAQPKFLSLNSSATNREFMLLQIQVSGKYFRTAGANAVTDGGGTLVGARLIAGEASSLDTVFSANHGKTKKISKLVSGSNFGNRSL